MQSLQEKAAEWSGVETTLAFAIDDNGGGANLFQKLGLQTFINLSTNFYDSSSLLVVHHARYYSSLIARCALTAVLHCSPLLLATCRLDSRCLQFFLCLCFSIVNMFLLISLLLHFTSN
nr:uncharacterized protein LOC112716183 isoform X2 [Arachis hypogaea]